jgi:hypothetical protein
MLEIGGLLDPVGRLWGCSVALVLLALMADKAVIAKGWTPKMLRALMLVLALFAASLAGIATSMAADVGALSWNIVISTLIYAAIIFLAGRLGSSIGHRISKRKPQLDSQAPADDRQATADDR